MVLNGFFWDGMESLVASPLDVEAMFTWCSNPCHYDCYMTFFTNKRLVQHDVFLLLEGGDEQ